MKKILIVISILLILPVLAFAGRSRKPTSPVQVRIAPTQEGVTSDQIKPGDVLEFKVSASSALATDDLRIDLDLLGGVKLVSGELSWRGPAEENEQKVLIVTVEVPKNGRGAVRARASLPPSDGTRFANTAVFEFGKEAEKKPGQEQPVKKDRKGRSIIEYH